ncbi:MAG: hypothetical protein HRF42_07735 [Candidatus Brocadia sp.]|jgi:hypothetical protein
MKLHDIHDIKVSTYAGYKADEKPLRFIFKGKTYTVKEILHQTYEEIPGVGLRRRFDIETDEGLTFNLLYDVNQDRWFLEGLN